MTLPSNANLPNYPFPANARTYDFEFIRMMNQCWAGGEGIAPLDNSKDCTLTGMGDNKATDLEATTGGSGLNVSVALGTAWVQGDTRTTQGLYFCYVPTATTVTMTTAHATLPRVDRLCLKVEDADAAGSVTQWSVVKVDGTATAGATLVNLTGAPALPANCLPIAYVLTTAAFTGPYVNATHILDQRYFAYRPGRVIGRVLSTTASSTIGDKQTLAVCSNGVNQLVASYNVRLTNNTDGTAPYVRLGDGAASAGTPYNFCYAAVNAVNGGHTISPTDIKLGAAFLGQKTFYLYLSTSVGTMTWQADATNEPSYFTIKYR